MEVFYSYAGVISDRNPNQNDRIMPQSIKDISWMLFIRQKSLLSFSFSAIITTTNTSGNGIFFHLELDEKDVLSHMEELGLEIAVEEFVALLMKTIQSRSCVDLVFTRDQEKSISLVLTYRFSDTISRKGHLNLSLTESQLPSPLIDLLLNVHTIDHVSVLSDREKASIEQKKQLQKSHINTMSTVTPSATCSATVIATSSQSRQESCTPLTPSSISAQLLKKRKLPSGIRRPGGAKGAKLAKLM